LLILDIIYSVYCFLFPAANICEHLKVILCEFINEIINMLRDDEWRQHMRCNILFVSQT